VGDEDGWFDGADVGGMVGSNVGLLCINVGSMVGDAVSSNVGYGVVVVATLGLRVGALDGFHVGVVDGCKLGDTDGGNVGKLDGVCVGYNVGEGVMNESYNTLTAKQMVPIFCKSVPCTNSSNISSA